MIISYPFLYTTIAPLQRGKTPTNECPVTQSVGTVEYTDCTSTEGWDPTLTSVLDMKLNNLMVRFQ